MLVDNGWSVARQRRADIGEMVSATEIDPLVRIVQKYAIGYVYVGPFEQEKHAGLLSLLRSAPNQFREVYSRDGVSIFQYLRTEVAR